MARLPAVLLTLGALAVAFLLLAAVYINAGAADQAQREAEEANAREQQQAPQR